MKDKTMWDYLDELDAEEIENLSAHNYDIHTEAEAEHALSQYKSIQRRISEVEISAQDYLEEAKRRTEGYLNAVREPLTKQLNFIESRLKDYATAKTAITGKRSVKLVNGTIGFVKAQAKYDVDTDKVIDFLQGLDDDNILRTFLKRQPDKLDWAGMKKVGTVHKVKDSEGDDHIQFKVYGQDIPFVEIDDDREDTFKIR